MVCHSEFRITVTSFRKDYWRLPDHDKSKALQCANGQWLAALNLVAQVNNIPVSRIRTRKGGIDDLAILSLLLWLVLSFWHSLCWYMIIMSSG